MNFFSNAVLENVPAVLREKFAEYFRRFGEKEGIGRLDFQKGGNFPHRDAYRISAGPDAVTVTAGSDEGLFYGAWEVLSRMETGFVSGVTDRVPLCGLRGVKIYLPEPTEKGMDNFRKLVDLMCRFRYNYLMIETGGAMEYKRHPEINEGWIEYSTFMNEYSGKPQKIQQSFGWNKNSIHTTNGGGRVVPQTMIREMIDYCRARYIEVVPELPSLGHCDYLLTRHPELAERPEDPYPDTVCPNHPGYYPLLFDLIDEHLELFRPKRMHLGHDEYYSVALCPRCKDIPAPKIYADDVTKCRDYLKSKGVEMMIWGEKLLNSSTLSGRPCGGNVNYFKDADGNVRVNAPALWPCRDLIPRDVQMMHWYWSIRREYDELYTQYGFPVMFGNLRSYIMPDWEKRIREPNVIGTCCSNWGSTDPVTMQRNGILFEIAYTGALHWGAANDFAPRRDEAFDALYTQNNVQNGPGRYMEILHRTTEARPFHCFFDGFFVDEKKDLLGYHVFTAEDGTVCRFPVLYGTNIPSGNAVFERSEQTGLFCTEEELQSLRDTYKADIQLPESSCSARPELHDGKVAARTRYRMPEDGKMYSYAGFDPVPGFAGKVELLSCREVLQK